jgi:hypothetical protein
MALRNSSTDGRSPVHVEAPRPDELPRAVPAPARPAEGRDRSGKFTPGSGTSELARKGARARHESRQLAQLLGLWQAPEGHPFAPYARLARDWRDAHIAALAANVGGGEVDPGAASVVSTAALELAASRWLFDQGAQGGDAKMLLDAARLGDASRQNILAAFELAAKAAAQRSGTRGTDAVIQRLMGAK